MGLKKRIAYMDAHKPAGPMGAPKDPIRRFIGNTWGLDLMTWGADETLISDEKYLEDMTKNPTKNFKDNKTLGTKYIDIKTLPLQYVDSISKKYINDDWSVEKLRVSVAPGISIAQNNIAISIHLETLLKKASGYLLNANTSFIDYSFDLDMPASEELIKKMNMPIQPKYAKATSMYNYYDAAYEDLAANTEFNSTPSAENILFNLYLLSLKEKLDYSSILAAKKYSKKYEAHFQEKGLPKNFNFQSIKASLQACEIDPVCANKAKGLYDWTAEEVLTEKVLAEFKKLPKRMRYLLFSSTDTDLLKDFEDKKYLFPMGIELEFSSQEVEAFTNTLAKAKSMFPLMYKAIAEQAGAGSSWLIPHLYNKEHFVKTKSGKGYKIQKNIESGMANNRNLISLPIDDFIKEYATKGNAALDKALEPQVTYITSGEEKIPTDKGTSFIEKLKAKILEDKLEQIIADKSLSAVELFNGALAHNEVVFFQIDKRKGNKTIQTIMIPNTEDVDIHKYFDSQIQYGHEYKYNVFTWSLVVGTEYKYISSKDLDKRFYITYTSQKANWSDLYFETNIAHRPIARMVRCTYFRYGLPDPIFVIDNPPVEPNVGVVPYKNEDRKVLITVDSGIGSYVAEPIEIGTEDKNIFDDIKKSQKSFLHDVEENKILFESDDPVTSFEIFRTTAKPNSYKDFAGTRLTSIETIDGGFVDEIAPNTRYYYTARATDVHGLISNPSAIYEVELINNSGTVYPKIRIVNLEKIEPLQNKIKPIKRFLKVEPIIEQIMINKEKAAKDYQTAEAMPKLGKGLTNYIGTLDESIFSEDKNFKIRITSKHTKKKMDINLRFRVSLTNNT